MEASCTSQCIIKDKRSRETKYISHSHIATLGRDTYLLSQLAIGRKVVVFKNGIAIERLSFLIQG